ncbi:hypothetical protein ACWERY_02285 [Streptomyces sp. NPDC004082]
MTAPRIPVYPDPSSLELLRRCYPGEPKAAVIARALRFLATADGHLDPAGRIKRGNGGRPQAGRRS